MSECTHNCSTCGESCGERKEPQSFLKAHHPDSRVGKVYGIVSGKVSLMMLPDIKIPNEA